jgi:hypothetical protein
MTIRQYLMKVRQDDARRAGERDRLLLEAATGPQGTPRVSRSRRPRPAYGGQPPGGAAAPAVPGADRRRRRPGASGDNRVDCYRGLARSGARPCRPPVWRPALSATGRERRSSCHPPRRDVRKLTTSDPS